MSDTFLFYDLETFGSDPRRTRIAQFAAIRTDADLNEVEDPIDFFVQPADDLLPSPAASMVTGISPQQALREGVNEAEAFARIFEALARPQTCTLGYNSLRFDDEFIRFGLYRNFYDAYEREWRGGNSRWDLLDVMRLAHALRPDGIHWRQREDGGGTSFKLEHLAEDNGHRQGMAHEALSDVRALIGLARQFKAAQPRLWDYALRLRDKRFAASLMDSIQMTPVLHISQKIPASRLCAAPVLPIARHPQIDSRTIVFDLTQDIDPLLELDAQEIAERLYIRQADLPEGEQRIGLKEVHSNRCPMLVAWNHLREADFARLNIDPQQVQANADALRAHGAQLAEKLRQVFARSGDFADTDADAALYAGFIPDSDKRQFPRLRSTPPESLAQAGITFTDARLNTLLLRYRARNWPHTLSFDEQEQWQTYRRQRLLDDSGLGELTLPQFHAQLVELRQVHEGDADKLALLDQLQAWGEHLQADLG